MKHKQHFAIVITHTGQWKDIVGMPWLQTEYRIDESDSIILSQDGWRAVAEGDPTIRDALERKLLVGSYLRQPQLIVVIGHPSNGGESAEMNQRADEVNRI